MGSHVIPNWPRGTFFTSLGAARYFIRGYCVPRVIVKRRPFSFQIVHPATAKRHGWRVVS